MSGRAWGVAVGLTILLASFSVGLPAAGFFAGDPGVKLIAARAAWAHPRRPLELDVPRINGAAEPQFLSPFFVPHEGHAHAVTSPVFPMVTAPFVGGLGLRGAYVVPVFSFGVLLVCMGILAERLRLADSTIAVLLTAFCSPMVFYGLEYWEHLPALAAAMAGWTMLVSGRAGWKVAAAGLLLSLAALLRPEGLWFCLAGAIAAMTALPWRSKAILAIAFIAGMLPLMVFNYLHFGNLYGLHVSSNLGSVAADWPRSRMMLLDRWFGPVDNWLVALALVLTLVGFLWSAAPRARIGGYLGSGLLCTAVALGWLPRENLWATAPSVALALGPGAHGQRMAIARVIGWGTFLSMVAVIATAPNDGGAQWGPRYLQFAIPPLLLVGAQKLQMLWRRGGTERWFARAAVVVVLLTALVTTRAAYRELRASKRYYARLAHAATLASQEVPFILSNIWWFDQISAGAVVEPTFLYVKDAASAQAALRRTSPESVLLATSGEPEFLTSLQEWTRGTCYVNKARQELRERRVVLQRIECSGPLPTSSIISP